MTKYADTFDAVVLGNGGSLAPLTELVELIDANGKARQVISYTSRPSRSFDLQAVLLTATRPHAKLAFLARPHQEAIALPLTLPSRHVEHAWILPRVCVNSLGTVSSTA